MSKDRRLGRGLAALLGTPVDESGVVEGMATESQIAPTNSGATSGSASGTATGTATGSLGGSAPTGLPPSTLAPLSPPKTRPAIASNPSHGVTGSVPLQSVLSNSGSTNQPLRTDADGLSIARGTESAATMAPGASIELRVDAIDSNPYQPRREFNPQEIESLAESLKEHQQLQPILVRLVGKRYQLISGERRLRAAIHAGLKTIRAEVREADDRMVAELAIVENLQRKDLNPIEKAMSFRRYLDEHACKQDELAKRLKIDRSTIANLMRLLELPKAISDAVQTDGLSAGHARALLPLSEESQQLDFARRIQAEGWSVRETERRVSEQLAAEDGEPSTADVPKKNRARTVTPQIASLEQELRRSLGTKIEIRQAARGRGRIVVHFSNAEEFDRIRDMLAPSQPRSAAS